MTSQTSFYYRGHLGSLHCVFVRWTSQPLRTRSGHISDQTLNSSGSFSILGPLLWALEQNFFGRLRGLSWSFWLPLSLATLSSSGVRSRACRAWLSFVGRTFQISSGKAAGESPPLRPTSWRSTGSGQKALDEPAEKYLPPNSADKPKRVYFVRRR